MSHFLSPLRYPGGKRKLSNFVKLVFRANTLTGGVYVEPYAGGAAIALSLLFSEYVSRIIINDLDSSIYAFWKVVLDDSDELCERIKEVEVNIDEWERQRAVQDAEAPSLVDLAFSTFFLNRTNRSGIIRGGVIGGKEQKGQWLIDARFNKTDLIRRIQKISRYRGRIELFNLDAASLILEMAPTLESRSLMYLDPPYFVKGGDLYQNYYNISDHQTIADVMKKVSTPWIITYDAVKPIKDIYKDVVNIQYGLNYSAQKRYKGSEIMFYSKGLLLPNVKDPARISQSDFYLLQQSFLF